MGNSINEGNGNNIRGKNSKMKQNNFMKTHSGGFGIGSNNNYSLIAHNHNSIVSMNMSISNNNNNNNNNKNIAMTSKHNHSPIILPKQRIITAK